METKNLWNDAAKYGAIVAVVSAAFEALGLFFLNGWISFVSLIIYVLMLYFFTKRRAILYGGGEEGFSYGRGLQFILCMSLLSGILLGAYQIVASNWLFTAKYDEISARTVMMLENMGFYTREQLDMMAELSRSLMRSPVFLLFSGVLSSVMKGLFWGLFVSALTRRKPDIFAGGNE